MTKEELDRLIKESEILKEQDMKAKDKIEAKNQLEQFCYSVRTTTNDEKLKYKFKPGEKEEIERKINDTLTWMNNNPYAEKEEYDCKVKEIEAIFHPIMQREGGNFTNHQQSESSGFSSNEPRQRFEETVD